MIDLNGMFLVIPFPQIDPVLFAIGPIAVRWYSLAYVAGLVIGWWLLRRQFSNNVTREHVDDFMIWATVGIIMGGRLGYVVFYKFQYFLSNPLEILATWQGGMSFHGGLIGVVIMSLLFCRRNKIQPLELGDMLSCVAPIGLFFGRIANFVNGELYGRVTDVSWGVIFPSGGSAPRHPSQLYEAALEGVVLFLVLNLMRRSQKIRQNQGVLTGVFIGGYALFRIIAEFFRQPDPHIGFLIIGSTMGQWLSLPMLIIGIGITIWGFRRAS